MTPTVDAFPVAEVPAHPPPARDWLDPPTFEETHGEWMCYHRTPVEVIDPDLTHFGQYVAFFDGRPWGYDQDATALRDRVATAFGIHRDRLFVAYLG